MINAKVYQQIYDELSRYMVPEASKLVVYLEYGEASYSFSFFEKINDVYVKCYDLEGVSDDMLADSFSEIDEIVSKERCSGKQPWTNMTMIVDKDGNMHADFDYTDLSGGTYQYKKNWKKKYLV